jgi:hypothetical protein
MVNTKENIDEYMIKEIDLIQDIIKRMANNSFLIKGWAITLIVVTLLFKGSTYQIAIAIIPLLSFWFLDGYFLRQERLYRKLYAWIIENRPNNKDFLFNLDATRFSNEVDPTYSVMFSITLLVFYGSIGIIIGLYLTLVYLIQNGYITLV